MSDLRAHLQSTLDGALAACGVYSYWIRKSDSGGDPDEYVVYTLDDNTYPFCADDAVLARVASLSIRYYYRDSLLRSSSGRTKIKNREEQISSALVSAGYNLPNGYFDAGDIDDIGFGTTAFTAEYWRFE